MEEARSIVFDRISYPPLITTKKRHIRDILGRTIIVTTPGIIIDVVGSYFYDKKS